MVKAGFTRAETAFLTEHDTHSSCNVGFGPRADTRKLQSLICPTSKAKIAHARHAQIARRANLPQAHGIAENPKSER